MSAASLIAAWRRDCPEERLTAATLREILGVTSLQDAYLRDAHLRYADLQGADLQGADLQGADLRGADLRYADLQGADLQGADLQGADLRGADLRYASLRDAHLPGLLVVTGLPSGDLTLLPTADGWWLWVDCWTGTVPELRTLIAQDSGWPEARGDEIVRRRPLLAAAADLCDAHIAAWPDAITEMREAHDLDPFTPKDAA